MAGRAGDPRSPYIIKPMAGKAKRRITASPIRGSPLHHQDKARGPKDPMRASQLQEREREREREIFA
jgi:hypothetical protein